MKLNKRQKFIASCCNPYYNKFATKVEVKAAKKLARGHYWYDADYEEYASFSPTGMKKFFTINIYSWAPWNRKKKWKELARKAAREWAKGDYVASNNTEILFWNLNNQVK